MGMVVFRQSSYAMWSHLGNHYRHLIIQGCRTGVGSRPGSSITLLLVELVATILGSSVTVHAGLGNL
jgi:hypothetical protein